MNVTSFLGEPARFVVQDDQDQVWWSLDGEEWRRDEPVLSTEEEVESAIRFIWKILENDR